MAKIKVVGFDPSMSNWGIAHALVDVDTFEVEMVDLELIKTHSEKNKGIIKQSDDLRRAIEVRNGMLKACEGAVCAISEIPFQLGSYSPAAAQANLNTGIVLGVLASCPIPLFQVFNDQVKMAVIGHRQAAKEEMIEWGMNRYPHLPWRMRMLRGKMVPIADNEHLADACAVIEAGVQTQLFCASMALYRAKAA